MYCVVYRTGGAANFKWHRSLTFRTRTAAEACAEGTRRMGYPAHVEVWAHSVSVGLPETFDATTPLSER